MYYCSFSPIPGLTKFQRVKSGIAEMSGNDCFPCLQKLTHMIYKWWAQASRKTYSHKIPGFTKFQWVKSGTAPSLWICCGIIWQQCLASFLSKIATKQKHTTCCLRKGTISHQSCRHNYNPSLCPHGSSWSGPSLHRNATIWRLLSASHNRSTPHIPIHVVTLYIWHWWGPSIFISFHGQIYLSCNAYHRLLGWIHLYWNLSAFALPWRLR